MKKGGKVFSGKVAAVGTKADVEAQMSELEGNRRERSPAKTNGETVHVHGLCMGGVRHACTYTCAMYTCMYMYNIYIVLESMILKVQ